MSAKIFAPPTEVGEAPTLSRMMKDNTVTKIEEFNVAAEAWTKKVQDWAKKNTRNPNSELVGMVYRYGVADGYAQYVILNTKPLELIHLPIGDAWQIPEVVRRGLILADLKEDKRRQEAYEKLFAAKKEST
jgi:hypothetical protein